MLFTCSHGRKIEVGGKILFLGDSITDMGMYVTYLNAYLELFQSGSGITLYNLGLSDETVCGLTEPGYGYPRPNINDRVDRAMLSVEPNWVVLMYGMNDGIYHPFSEERFSAYKDGMWKLIHRLQEYGVHIVVMTPSPFETAAVPEGLQEDGAEHYDFINASIHYDDVLKRYGQFILEEVAPEVDLVIDIHRALEGGIYTEDRVHPGWKGHYLIAREILKRLFHVHVERLDQVIPDELRDRFYSRDQLLHQFYVEAAGYEKPDHYETDTYRRTMLKYQGLNRKVAEYIDENPDMFKPQVSQWHGFQREDFYFRGYEGVVVKPDPEMENGGWIWKMEFFEGDTPPELEMVKRGFHLVYYRVSDQYGAPLILPYMESFYHYVREEYGLTQQMIPIGVSRGGLYALLLAEARPSWIRAMYLDAPVVDIYSWPKEDNLPDWEECKAIWEADEKDPSAFRTILESRLLTMSMAEVPLVLVYGEADTVVPYEKNGRLLEEAYQNSEADRLFIGKPGVGHHPHSLEDPTPIVDFLLRTEDMGLNFSSYVNVRSWKKTGGRPE